MNRAQLQTVVEDLEYLNSDWVKDISDPEARRGSAILRRLLVEDAYGRAWRAIGLQQQPKVIAVDIKNFLGSAPQSDVDIALPAGVKIREVMMAGMCLLNRHHPANPGPPITPDGFPGEREYTLSQYLGSEAGIVRGRAATRRDVIKYFANVKGGVHLGTAERKAEAKLVARMEKFEKRVSFFKKDGLLCEVIAIGYSLARSPNTQRFIKKANTSLQRPSR